MDIENLSKSELIMAALLISFVTALLTGTVIIFLSEDAPEDVIRVSEKVISDESADNNATSTESDSRNSATTTTDEVSSRDDILEAAVKAVARVTSDTTNPQAGVLINTGNEAAVVTASADFQTNVQALFENGVIAHLSSPQTMNSEFLVLPVQEASGEINPLDVSNQLPEPDQLLFVVPLSQQPEIAQISITDVSDGFITTTAGTLPPTSLLLNSSGSVVGVYEPAAEAFRIVGQINL